MFEPMMEMSDDAVIKVVGVGGGGGNAVEHMVRESIEGWSSSVLIQMPKRYVK